MVEYLLTGVKESEFKNPLGRLTDISWCRKVEPESKNNTMHQPCMIQIFSQLTTVNLRTFHRKGIRDSSCLVG